VFLKSPGTATAKRIDTSFAFERLRKEQEGGGKCLWNISTDKLWAEKIEEGAVDILGGGLRVISRRV